MDCLFLYNPVSGRGKVAKKLGYILSSLGQSFEKVDVYATTGPGDMTRAAREGAARYGAIVFAGGDGSVNEVVQGVCVAETAPLLGYIPTGTVNDVAHSLGISKNIRRALKTIRTGKTAMLDCMRVNDRFAMYVVAAGAFTSASYTTPQAQKKRVGRIAYGIEGIKKNLKFDTFDVAGSVDGARYERQSSVFVMLMNGRSVAGMTNTLLCRVFVMLMNGRSVAGRRLNKGGSMCDGKVEAAVILQGKKPNFLRRVRSLIAIANLFLFGYRVREKRIVRLEGKHFEIEAEEGVVWNFDGERGIEGSVTVDVLPGRVPMLVPAGSRRI